MGLGSIGLETCNLNILHPRSVMPFTSISASWMNIVERFSLGLSEECLRRGVSERIEAVEERIAVHNEKLKPFIRTVKSKDFLARAVRASSRPGLKKCSIGSSHEPLNMP